MEVLDPLFRVQIYWLQKHVEFQRILPTVKIYHDGGKELEPP
jgi:hypothetical protein